MRYCERIYRENMLCMCTSKKVLRKRFSEKRFFMLADSALCSSPPFSLEDLFLPLAVRRAKTGVMFHLAGDYLTNAPFYRAAWWRRMESERRIACINGLPLCRKGVRRCQWVLVCKTEKILKQVLKAPAGYTRVITYVV